MANNKEVVIPKIPQSVFDVISSGFAYCKKVYLKVLSLTFVYAIVGIIPAFFQFKKPEHFQNAINTMNRAGGTGGMSGSDNQTVHVMEQISNKLTAATTNATATVNTASSNSEAAIESFPKIQIAFEQLSVWQSIGVFVIQVVYLSILLILYSAIIHRVNNVLKNKNTTLGDSLSYAGSRIWSLWGLAILYAIFTFIGFILFVLPGIYIMFLLYFSFYALMIHELGIIDSLKRSKDLVWGHWWRTVWTMFLVILGVTILDVFILYLIVNSGFPNLGLTVLTVQLLFQALIYPVTISIFMSLYYDLEARLLVKSQS